MQRTKPETNDVINETVSSVQKEYTIVYSILQTVLQTVHTNSWCSRDVPNKHHVSVTFQCTVEALGLFQVGNHTAGPSVFSCCRPNECINCLMSLNVLPASVFAGYGSLAGDGYPGARPGEPWLRSYLLPSLSALILTLTAVLWCCSLHTHTLVASVMVKNLLTNSLLHSYISLDVYIKRIECSCGVTGMVLMLLCPGFCWPIP